MGQIISNAPQYTILPVLTWNLVPSTTKVSGAMGDCPVHQRGSMTLGRRLWNLGSSGTAWARPLMALAAPSLVAHSLSRRAVGEGSIVLNAQ